MIRFRTFLRLTAAALVCAAVLGPTSLARAGWTVAVYDDGNLQSGVTATVLNNKLVLFGGSTDHFEITGGQGSSNFPGLETGASLTQASSAQVGSGVNFFSGGNTHTLTIVISEAGYTAPTGTPLSISSSTTGGSVGSTGGTVSVSATNQAFVDTSGAAYGSPLSYVTPGGAFTGIASGTSTVLSGGSNGLNLLPGSVSNNNITGGTPFTITDVLTFSFTLDAGGSGTAGLSATTVVAVPAPAGLVLALTGIPCLGLVSRFRRRRTA